MSRYKLAFILASGCALLTTAGYAQQTANPGGMSPDTPGKETAQPAPEGSNTQDKLFVRQAALGGQAEVELSKIAQQRATNESVREFAKRMVDVHSKSNQQLLRVGRSLNPDLPKELDPEHQTVRNELQKASGQSFDIAYISAQIQDHQRTANLLQWHISTGQKRGIEKIFDGDAAGGDGSPRARQTELRPVDAGRWFESLNVTRQPVI
jgi:putative membrane protein